MGTPSPPCAPSNRLGQSLIDLLGTIEALQACGWAKKHPDDAVMMGGLLFFRYLQNERPDLLDFRALAGSGKLFTVGLGIGWKISLSGPKLGDRRPCKSVAGLTS